MHLALGGSAINDAVSLYQPQVNVSDFKSVSVREPLVCVSEYKGVLVSVREC